MTKPKVLFVLTSAGSYPKTDGTSRITGWYLPEFAHPYYQVSPHADIVVASPKGGKAPLDPDSVEAFKNDKESTEFLSTKSALWENTEKLSDYLGKADQFAAIFYVGGHGPMFDLAEDKTSHTVIREFWESGKVVSAVCHGPIALANVKLADGTYLVEGSPVNGFSNVEEDQSGHTEHMPYLLEDVLKKNGGLFEANDAWQEKVVIGKDGRLITGQNPASASALGKAIVQVISKA